MSEIVIPFSPEMAHAAMTDNKTKTSRNKRYGEPGDTFDIWLNISLEPRSCKFRLVSVERHTLGKVASTFFQEEGFDHPDEFIAIWNRLHPTKRFNPDHLVWVHTFEKVVQ